MSLPIEHDVAARLPELSASFSRAMAIDIQHISISWQFYTGRHYCVSGRSSETLASGFPIKVQLLTPNLYRLPSIEKMLAFLAQEVSAIAQTCIEEVFVYHQDVASGHVFDEGRVLRW